MIARIQYCVDVTDDVKSNWAVYAAPNQFNIQKLFNTIYAGKLLLFGLF